MGMAASQARFLSLTARKTNVEYEGQQVNQQRTTLSNQSANYYNDLLGMSVPVPPSVEDYTKTVYTFQDGALSNSITSMVAKAGGLYTVSYLTSWVDDFSVVSGVSHVVVKVGDDKEGEELFEQFKNGTASGCYTYLNDKNNDSDIPKQFKHIIHVANHLLGEGTHETSDGKTVTVGNDGDQINGIYWTTPNGGFGGDGRIMAEIASNISGKPITKKLADLLYNARQIYATPENITQSDLDYMRDQLNNIVNEDLRKSLNTSYMVGKDKLRDLGVIEVTFDNEGNITSYLGNDEYLKTLSNEQLKKTIEEEKEYQKLLDEKYGNSNWMVRYILNTSTNKYEPEFYNKIALNNAIYSDHNDSLLTSMRCYKIGADTKTEEIKNVAARFEQDTTGRLIKITLHPGEEDQVTYAISTNTVTDQAKYDDAMNQYEYDKAQYAQSVQEINAKIEIIQAEDKNLELRLKQLDTEQEAIQTEMEAVQKVIEKNTESTFKTFG